MVKRILAVVFVLVLAISLATVTFAQEKQAEMKKEGKKMEMTKEEKAVGPLKSVNCDATCGFMCRSHSEKELTSVVKTHAKKMHKMDLRTRR